MIECRTLEAGLYNKVNGFTDSVVREQTEFVGHLVDDRADQPRNINTWYGALDCSAPPTA